MTAKNINMLRIPLPIQKCKVQNTNKKVYDRKKVKKERY